MRPIRSRRSIPRLLAGVTSICLLFLGLQTLPAMAAGSARTAPARAAAASSSVAAHPAGRLDDGDRDSYWQSSGSALPQWAQVDLGRSTRVDQVRLAVPAGWSARTETLSLQASEDGTTFSTLKSSAAYSFKPSAGNTVTAAFPAAKARYVRAVVTANSAGKTAQLSELTVRAAAASTTNLALGRPTAESGHADVYPSGNAVDGDANTYWESANNAFPQWIRVDLGSAVPVNQVVLKLPPSTAWATRTQTLAVQGSTDGSTFSDLVASAGYTFNPATANTVTISFNTATTRYVRLYVTGNTGWPAGQVSEFEVYGPTTGDVTAPSAPANLAFTQPASGQIKLTWSASSDNVGVTGYDIYANGSLRTSVAGNVTTYTDSQPDTATVSYYVRAKDAAGNQSANSNTVTRTGSSGDTQPPSAPSNLAFTQPASGQIKLTWSASSDNVAVTGYEVFANGAKIATTAAGTLTYTDNQASTATVSYFVRAVDAAGNESGNSNTVTRTGTSPTGTNLAVGKPITATSTVQNFVAANANDDDVTTYWEGTGTSSLTVQLGANVDTSQVVVKLNPSSAWGPRTQTIEVQGREQSASSFTQLVAPKSYSFDPATGNSVTIPVSGRVADVRLVFSANSGAGGGQAAEFQVIGVPGPNPDLTVSSLTASPSAPVETDPITLGRHGPQHRHQRLRGDRRQPLPRHHQGRDRLRGRARRGREHHRLCRHRRPERGQLPADRQGRRVQPRHRAERDQQQLHQPDRPGGQAGRQLRPDRLARGMVPVQPLGGQQRRLLGGGQEPGHRRVRGRQPRHHPDRRRRLDGQRGQDPHRLLQRVHRGGRHHQPGEPG